jgi:ADP-heptose:LPS heptosyltransferase
MLDNLIRNIIYFIFKIVFANKEVELPVDISKIKKVLILRYDVIGDMIVTLPVIHFFKKMNPNIIVDVLASVSNKDILKYDQRVRNVIVSTGKQLDLIRKSLSIRNENYDVVCSFVYNKTTIAGLVSNFASRKTAIKIAMRHEERYKMYSTFFNVQIPPADLRNKYTFSEIQVMMMCKVFGVVYNDDLVKMKICCDDESRNKARNFISRIPSDCHVMVNISAGKDYRKWNLENYRELIKKITDANDNIKVIIISSPDDFGEILSLAGSFPDRAFPYPTANILVAVAILELMKFVISPDTSIVHAASACGVPVVALYSLINTVIREWMPFGVKYKAVMTDDKLPLDSIPPERVFRAFQNLYDEICKK